MPAASRLRYLYLAYLSQPAADRAIFRAIRAHKPRSIVEIGLSGLRRTERIIAVAQRYLGETTLRYTGVDRFEDQPAADRPLGHPTVSLMQAFKALRPLGVTLRLEPGDPFWALQRAANSLAGTDLLLIGADADADRMAQAWFYVPRMLHADSLVLIEETNAKGAGVFRRMTAMEIQRLAAAPRRAAA